MKSTSTNTPQIEEKPFARKEISTARGEQIDYYVYPGGTVQSERTLVYIHGLVSDISWFEIPDDLPEGTSILFLPRHPRTHASRYEQWMENYESCFLDFKASHGSRYFHLVAQCFGTQPALHWITERPEHFATVTLVNPPVEVRDKFNPGTVLKIAFGSSTACRECLLTPTTYGRLPGLVQFIENNPTTTYQFTNSFFRQTARLRRWLRANVITFPAPTHCVFSSEDKVVEYEALKVSPPLRELPARTTFFHGDHFLERSPSRTLFWRSVQGFQLEHEQEWPSEQKIHNVLVTGGTGFLGSHIVRELHAGGKDVTLFLRDPDKGRAMFRDLGERIHFRKGELTDLTAIDAAMDGVDAIVHTAGHVREWDSYRNFETTNVEGTKNVLIAGHDKGIKQFVHISSLGVFGDTDQDHISENNRYVLSTDYYSNSKIHAEIFVKNYCTENRIAFGIVRPGFIYGEGDNNFFPNLIRNLRSGKVKYIGSKDNFVNTVYVGNVVALVDAMIGNADSFGNTYNIADPQDTTISEIVERVSDHIGVPAPTKVIPKPAAVGLATGFEFAYRLFRIKKAPPISRKKLTFVGRSRSVNAGRAFKLIGRTPFTFEEGMEKTLESLEK